MSSPSETPVIEAPEKSTLSSLNEEPKEEKPEEEIEEEVKLNDDDIDIDSPVKRKELLAAYPDIFKKFPYLEKSMYREQQYSELFPTMSDAKVAAERSQILARAESELSNGSTEEILKSVKNNDNEAFLRIVDNFLPTLQKLDNGSYIHVLGNIGKGFIQTIVNEANRRGKESEDGKTLMGTAVVLNQVLFGNSEWKPPSALAKPVSEEEKKVVTEREQFARQRFDEVHADLSERADNAIKSAIERNIDPRESMSGYVRSKAVDDCMSILDRAITDDTNFKTKLDRLWEDVFRTGFSRAAQDKVKAAYLSKAQTLLPEIIKKVRGSALSGMRGKATTRSSSRVEDNEEKPKVSSRSATPERRPTRKMRTIDFLNQD